MSLLKAVGNLNEIESGCAAVLQEYEWLGKELLMTVLSSDGGPTVVISLELKLVR